MHILNVYFCSHAVDMNDDGSAHHAHWMHREYRTKSSVCFKSKTFDETRAKIMHSKQPEVGFLRQTGSNKCAYFPFADVLSTLFATYMPFNKLIVE